MEILLGKKISAITIIIPCRLDTFERLENILVVTSYLMDKIDIKIIVVEANNSGSGILNKHLNKEIDYVFIHDPDPIFYRTYYINKIAKKVNTQAIGIWDTDIIIPFEQIQKAIDILKNNEADFVYPYDKLFLDTSPILRRMYLKEGNMDVLLKNMKKMKEMYPPNPLGGAYLANMKAYRESGFENENFYGWGLEDGERYYRWEKMGYRIKRVPGPLFHLSHGRGINSTFHDADQHFNKKRELLNVIRASNTEKNLCRIDTPLMLKDGSNSV
jgi:predicted glycosyltransferase involved in capsule biosynthesis